jgi:hypothetical protein
MVYQQGWWYGGACKEALQLLLVMVVLHSRQGHTATPSG